MTTEDSAVASALDDPLGRTRFRNPDMNAPTRDRIARLLDVYSVHLGPVELVADAADLQNDPAVAELKRRLELQFRRRLECDALETNECDVAAAFRQIAHENRVPAIYEWLADLATREELALFIALEGGPDADFDDLVALAQRGLAGRPKLTLAANYWDEMGRGTLAHVHTELHRRMVEALNIPAPGPDEIPLEALERKVLNGYLAVNRSLQPELIGSLGLIECQAGPRCRRIVDGMQRLGIDRDAWAFYEEHALADPRHGKDWIDGAVVPLVEAHPTWGPRILRGARWRARVNERFFAQMEEQFWATPTGGPHHATRVDPHVQGQEPRAAQTSPHAA